MITIRRAEDRGHADHGWLNSFHTFSFASYHDPRQMGFRGLRVINDDRVKAGMGFGTHAHQDMEIVSYVLEGALAHKDSLGNGSVMRPGDVQRMSAGTGVRHSEFNPSPDEGAHFLQIWIEPRTTGTAPGYEQKSFAAADKQGQWRLVAAPDGAEGSVILGADARIFATLLVPGDRLDRRLDRGRHAWVHVASGALSLNGERLKTGDGAAISDEETLQVVATLPSEVLLFDLA